MHGMLHWNVCCVVCSCWLSLIWKVKDWKIQAFWDVTMWPWVGNSRRLKGSWYMEWRQRWSYTQTLNLTISVPIEWGAGFCAWSLEASVGGTEAIPIGSLFFFSFSLFFFFSFFFKFSSLFRGCSVNKLKYNSHHVVPNAHIFLVIIFLISVLAT